jgi:probable rRNA maturation factor
MPITIEEDPAFSGFNQAIIQNIINTVFEKEGYAVDNIALVFGNDDLLNSLKKEFFKKDHLTDVIAFRLNDYAEKNVEGEIYISVPRAKENAKSFKEPFAKEVSRLIIHGGLHLLNYDDGTKEDKDTMTGKEETYLKQCPWQNLIHE